MINAPFFRLFCIQMVVLTYVQHIVAAFTGRKGPVTLQALKTAVIHSRFKGHAPAKTEHFHHHFRAALGKAVSNELIKIVRRGVYRLAPKTKRKNS